ncbi:DUF4245 domain-containing protein [Actinophytocola gossypii]|uniref:DUF4245 domain-containing protein n=1 Tax=Actinophytocola gossypii TaxID=2812003 RepID=A0ABT2JJE5_9PSEU|nr:DUF4245 domain-containing protein [Actinophytocola gossypii]MCT2587515.1 DUF4245 domain-containing protein [Actinophytocola gossypii]
MVDTEPGGHRPPGRAGLRMRDMVGAILVLLVIVGVLASVTQSCSFDPGGPDVGPENAPTVDVSAKLGDAARSVTYPVRQPATPEGWRANSSSTSGVGTGAEANSVVRVGWVTPGGRYVQLSQSGGTAADVLDTETGESGRPTGTAEAGGVTWDVHTSRRDEVAWVTTLDGTVTLVTGNGTEDEFRTLAEATLDASPLVS